MKYTQDQLTELFIQAVNLFNETMGEEYSVGDNGIMLRFFTPDNGIEVYENFCGTYFPHHLNEDYKRREKFENISAEAFVGEHHDGVMVRADLPFPELELIQIFVHEIAHIYCTHNEIGGENFYQKYCDAPDHPIYGENIDRKMNGYINAGYAVWREMIADIISLEAIMDICQLRITDKMIRELYEQVVYGDPGAKAAAARMIAFVMLKNEKDVTMQYPFFNKSTVRMMELANQNLSKQPFFQISPDFIAKLGSSYVMALTEKMFRK